MTLVYVSPASRVTHILRETDSPNSFAAAVCGRDPWPGLWMGTGTQDEHDEALRRRLCTECQKGGTG